MLLTVVLESFVINDNIDQRMLEVNITNTSCTKSVHIARKIFLHKCFKNNKTVYDLRYFWTDENHTLRASIIGLQISETEYKKFCQICPD